MQLHLYLPDAVAEEVRRRAEARGVSVSRYLAELVAREVHGGWPDGFFEKVVGKWEGELLERPAQGELESRERL
ncbi:MAG: hypothetical protein IPM35_17915 [Myxococcales bacterium]|nr:hypothetical protein [Myxococcales bacterium]